MKTSAMLNSTPAPDVRATPPILQAACQDVAKHVTALMCMHGIQQLRAKVVQVGARAIVTRDYIPMPIPVPPTLEAIQGTAAAALIDYMTLFGIHSLEIVPAPEDLAAMANGFVELNTQAELLRQSLSPKQAPTQDPDGKPVVLG